MGAFGYLKRVIITPAVYPGLFELLHFDIQSTGQKSHCAKNLLRPSQRTGPKSHCTNTLSQGGLGFRAYRG